MAGTPKTAERSPEDAAAEVQQAAQAHADRISAAEAEAAEAADAQQLKPAEVSWVTADEHGKSVTK